MQQAQYSDNTKTFVHENMTPMDDLITYNYRKNKKRNERIHRCFSWDGIINIKCEEKAKHVRIFQRDKLHQLFLKFGFSDADEDNDFFLDVSQIANDSAASS